MGLFNWNKRCFKKGKRYAWPPVFWFKKRPKVIEYEVTFHDSFPYTHDPKNQTDWLKLLGATFNLFNSQINSVMVGMAWNPESQVVELNAYYHDAGSTAYTKALTTVELNKPKKGWIYIDYEKKKYTHVFMDDPVDGWENGVVHNQTFTHNKKLARAINGWFGGDIERPQKKHCYTLKIKVK